MTPVNLMSGYVNLLSLQKEADAAHQKAMAAAEPWEEIANKILKEKGLMGGGTFRFSETKVHYLCSGTGIYRDNEWWESFPVEWLMERAHQDADSHTK